MHSSSQDCSFCGSQSEPRWATRFFVSFVTIDSASGDAVGGTDSASVASAAVAAAYTAADLLCPVPPV